MSRALDKDVLNFLSQGDPGKAYDDISCLFDSPRDDGLLEIEILGKSQPLVPDVSFLADGNAVGIPKIRLFQAFSVAYKRFQQSVLRPDPRASDYDSNILLRPTAVLLLADPEHLTAANTRKRAILRNVKDSRDIKGTLGREKWFVDSLLTSRLHRHTKSPILWSHRRWLLTQFQKYKLQLDIPTEIRTIILTSGERHPKNYYAWEHARWLLRTFVDRQAEETTILQEIAADVRDWCLKHHSDISGWAYLHFVLRRGGVELAGERSGAFRGILQMAESFKWKNESVWWFIHAMVATNLLPPEDVSLLEEIGGRMFGLGPGGTDSDRPAKWFRIFRESQTI
ncbi:hypothetical protein VUR80DRAFT_7515 [Thermomyces stellatus]